MIRRITMWAATAVLVVALAAPAVFAASLKQSCEGEWVKLGGGEFQCVSYSNPGTDNPNAATPQEDQTTQTGNGGGGGEARNASSEVVGIGNH